MLQFAREIAPSVSWEILVRVKRSGGMSVNELAAELKMSYMGVKQHCDELRKQGYVDTWRRSKGTGRPEKIYRPTPKLDVVFSNWGGELCQGILALAAQLYGETVPERLLLGFLQQKVERWVAKMKGRTLRDRLTELVKMRNADGWMSEIGETDDRQVTIVDHHSPLAEIARHYPNVWEMESRLLGNAFGCVLERNMDGTRSQLIVPLPLAAATVAPAAIPELVQAPPTSIQEFEPESELGPEIEPVVAGEPETPSEPEAEVRHVPPPAVVDEPPLPKVVKPALPVVIKIPVSIPPSQEKAAVMQPDLFGFDS